VIGGEEDRTLEVADDVAASCDALGIGTAVIGAAALAVHNYSRATVDFDLATDVDPFRILPRLVKALEEKGYAVELVEPDAQDPLGGVLNITGPGFSMVQVVNFENPLSNARTPATAAIKNAESGRIEGTRLRTVTLADLVALKLYAGGAKSQLDVIELLARNQPVDLDNVRRVCAAAGLEPELEAVLRVR